MVARIRHIFENDHVENNAPADSRFLRAGNARPYMKQGKRKLFLSGEEAKIDVLPVMKDSEEAS